jgi:oxalate decarboxylase/phosphoglucose isomerase-like protein (cupin superfamily)
MEWVTMSALRIIKADDVQPQNIRGEGKEAGQIKRIVATDKFFFNIDEISPGFSPHRWHRHTKYRAEGVEVEYPPDFEEIYFVISGRGVIQWKTDGGEIREQAVGPGDTMHMPPDVMEHQLLNNGSDTLRIAVVGVPPPKRTRIG